MKILLGKIRLDKRITLRDLEKRSGISRSAINNIENEKVSPTLVQLEKLAIALKARITDLFESDYK